MDRERLGRLVRETWEQWAREQTKECDQCDGHGDLMRMTVDVDGNLMRGENRKCRDCDGTGKRAKFSCITPWAELTEPAREVDRLIADAVARAVVGDVNAELLRMIRDDGRSEDANTALAIAAARIDRMLGPTTPDLAGLAAREGQP